MSDEITAAIEQSVADMAPEPVIADTDPVEGDDAPTPVDPAPADPEPPKEDAASTPTPEGEKPKAKKKGLLPYERHEKILTKAREEAAAAQAALNARVEALTKQHESEDAKAQRQFLQILETDPARAVKILQTVDPTRFGKLTWAEQQAAAAAAAEQAPAPRAPVGDPGPRPEPDEIRPDGTLGYTAEAQQKLIEWHLATERANFEKELAALRADIAPVKEERKAREAYGKSLTKMGTVLKQARETWPEFQTHETAIKHYLEQNQRASLEEAYRAVVVAPSFQTRAAREAAIVAETRRKLIEEQNAMAAKGRTIKPGGLPAAGATPSGPMDEDAAITAAIKESIRGLA